MTELVLRFAGGMQALIGMGLAIAALGRLGDTGGRPGDVVGWAAFAIGTALIGTMLAVALRVALGDEQAAGRGAVLLCASLIAGLGGALMVAVSAPG